MTKWMIKRLPEAKQKEILYEIRWKILDLERKDDLTKKEQKQFKALQKEHLKFESLIFKDAIKEAEAKAAPMTVAQLTEFKLKLLGVDFFTDETCGNPECLRYRSNEREYLDTLIKEVEKQIALSKSIK